jgi:hypothetical protein
MTTATDTELQTAAAFKRLLDKYESLVWYARKAPADNVEYWSKLPDEIKTGALNAMAQVEEHHPDEVDSLRCCECGDFSHGFNSGVLAALRWVLTAQEEGIEEADNCFPELDT